MGTCSSPRNMARPSVKDIDSLQYLMTFLVTNLATFALDIGSAPNFRPSFQFFNWQTAAIGAVVSGATMVR